MKSPGLPPAQSCVDVAKFGLTPALVRFIDVLAEITYARLLKQTAAKESGSNGSPELGETEGDLCPA